MSSWGGSRKGSYRTGGSSHHSYDDNSWYKVDEWDKTTHARWYGTSSSEGDYGSWRWEGPSVKDTTTSHTLHPRGRSRRPRSMTPDDGRSTVVLTPGPNWRAPDVNAHNKVCQTKKKPLEPDDPNYKSN